MRDRWEEFRLVLDQRSPGGGRHSAIAAHGITKAEAEYSFSTAHSKGSGLSPFLQPSRSHQTSNIRAVRLIIGWCIMSPGKQVGGLRMQGKQDNILAFQIPVSSRRSRYSASLRELIAFYCSVELCGLILWYLLLNG